jgi:dynein assembly factor 3
MVEILTSYDSKYPYDIEKYRNDRIRYALKDRYDYRRNMYDWDYNMNMQKYAPIVRLQHYMYWRENGIAFVMRLNEYKQPNRTLANYIEGRNKVNKDSCMVRGFWGDIVNSPYISYGLELETKDEIDYFYQNNKINYLRDSQDVTEYNLVKFLLRLDHNENYDFMKREKEKEKQRRERIEKEEAEKAKKAKEEEEKKNKKLDKIKEEDEEDVKEEDNENEINTDSDETKKKKEIEKMKKEAERIKEEDKNLLQLNNKNALEEISKKVAENMKTEKEETTEESLINATTNNDNKNKELKKDELLQAFREVKFKLHFLSGDIEKSVYKKKKFKNYFDVILYGFHAATKFSEKQKEVIKNSTRILFEMNSHMTSFTDKQRKEFTDNLTKMCKEKGFILDDTSFKYIYQFKLNVKNNNENKDENNDENNEKNENEISTTNETTSTVNS